MEQELKPAVLSIKANSIFTNDGTHGPHDDENPDDGSTSQFALDLAAGLEELGIKTVVERLD